MNKYDVIIVGAGPGGIFSAYELVTNAPDCRVAVFEAGHSLEKRRCPIDGDKIKKCIGCKSMAERERSFIQLRGRNSRKYACRIS